MAANLLIKRLGSTPKDLWESDSGKEARGTIDCECGATATVSCCSDVSGVWINCNSCGHFEDI